MYIQNKRGGNLKIILTSIASSVITFSLLMLFVGDSGLFTNNKPNNNSAQINRLSAEAQDINTPNNPTNQINSNEPITKVVSRTTKSVVGIAMKEKTNDSLFTKDTSNTWSIGTGMVVDKNGYILTNAHVAGQSNTNVIVTFQDGSNVPGVTLWSEPVIDVAIVKVPVTNLPAVALGNSNNLSVGETAIAIGNPLGLEFERSVTSGIVSALDRTIKIDTEHGPNYMEDLIQTDASINPGNSGGPLLNIKGEVIGINSIKVSSAESIGFAIPINITKPIINKFINNSSFNEAYLGLFAYDRHIIRYINSDVNLTSGIYVVEVDPNGPAGMAGIKVGDVILSINNTPINKMADLRSIIYTRSPNDVLSIVLIQNGQQKTVSVRLGKKDGTNHTINR